MKKLPLALVFALSLSGAAQAFDLNGMLSSGSDLLKAATLSDADVKNLAAESSAASDEPEK